MRRSVIKSPKQENQEQQEERQDRERQDRERQQEERQQEERAPSTPTPEKSEDEIRKEYLSSLLDQVSKNPSSRKAQKRYHRASSDCEDSEEEESLDYVKPYMSREEALKLALKKAEEKRAESGKN